MESSKGFRPERPVFDNYDVEQILQEFTPEEILEADAYQLEHTADDDSDVKEGKVSTLFESPLPSNFAPDKNTAMLTHNRLDNRSQNTKDNFKEDVVANAIKRAIARTRKEQLDRASTGRALRTRMVIIACMSYLAQQATESQAEEAKTEAT